MNTRSFGIVASVVLLQPGQSQGLGRGGDDLLLRRQVTAVMSDG